MILFCLSFLMIFVTSYMIASMFADNKSEFGIIYLLLSAYANVIATIEVLSLFSAISVPGVLLLNMLALVVTTFLWNKKGRPIWKLSDVKHFSRKYINAIKLDKSLAVLSIGFVFLLLVSIFLSFIIPVVNADASSYHVIRSVFWVTNKNLNHFPFADIRALVFPINSEIVYTWIILFTKKLVWFGFVSYAGFILTITSVYKICSMMGFSLRRKLWIIFMLSSFSSVLVQISSTETDIIISGLVISSLFLYWYSVKNEKKVPIYFSSLAYALAIGTKTTAIIAIPAVGIAMLGISVYYLRKEFYRPILRFLFYGFFNFIIFSSYNYILNFVDYKNFAGSDSMMQAHINPYGARAIPANFIKYLFMFFDFTGFHWADYCGKIIISLRDSFLSAIGFEDIEDGIYTTYKVVNKSLLEPLMGLGILGIITYLPCWLISLVKPICIKNKKTWMLAAFGGLLVLNIIVMSAQLQFMVYSIRFLTFFCVLSSPILYYSYKKKFGFYKGILILFSLFYMTLVSTHLWARPFTRIINYFRHGYTISQVRETANCGAFLKDINLVPKGDERKEYFNESCTVVNYIKDNIDKENRILYFANTSTDLLLLKMLDFEGYHIDYAVAEDIRNIDINKYNLIMTIFNEQYATNIKYFDTRKSDIYISPITRKIYYRANSDVPCFYLSTNYRMITDRHNPELRPYIMRCMISNEYYYANNFSKMAEFEVKVPSKEMDGKEETFGYYFYKNMNKPFIELSK